MELIFATEALADLCGSEELMVGRWGRDGFLAVGRRLLELAALPAFDAVRVLPRARIARSGKRAVRIKFGGEVLIVATVVEVTDEEQQLRISTVEYQGEGA